MPLFDPALVARLADSGVGEHLRAVFVPLIRSRTTATETRLAESAPKSLNTWNLIKSPSAIAIRHYKQTKRY